MPSAGVALIGGSIITGAISANAQSKAAEGASQAQLEASRLGIAEQRRQFDAFQKALGPYAQAGERSLERQETIAGLRGPEAQAEFIKEIEGSPAFEATARQGESAILQNASATGGLRGGDVQGALAQFRPQLLAQFISREYDRLGGLTQIGQSSAAGVGAAGLQTGQNISGLLGEAGAATAGNILTQGNIQAGMWGTVGKNVGVAVERFEKGKLF